MSVTTSNLQINGLYIIMLFIRNHPPLPDDFHWALYFHQHPDTGGGGMKYHIKSEGGSNSWIADHGPTAGVLKAFLLVGLFKIADVPEGWDGELDRVMRTYDGCLNNYIPEDKTKEQEDTFKMTCRVWVLLVLALLQKSTTNTTNDDDSGNENKVLKCTDLEALESEVKNWGNEHAMSAADNIQPRPVASSLLAAL